MGMGLEMIVKICNTTQLRRIIQKKEKLYNIRPKSKKDDLKFFVDIVKTQSYLYDKDLDQEMHLFQCNKII